MMKHAGHLKMKILQTLVWLFLFPFLALWPFLSALPLFSILNSSQLDGTISLNIIFFLTGFWPLAAFGSAALVLMYDDTRKRALLKIRGRGLFIGGYAILWTGLYMIVSILTH